MSWQFVILTSVAMICSLVAWIYDGHESTIVVTAIGLLYGQAMTFLKSQQIKDTVVTKASETQQKLDDKAAEVKKEVKETKQAVTENTELCQGMADSVNKEGKRTINQ